ncbi:LexA family protein [Sphingobium sp. YG1]|uniref:LexA family protein n=1 Tax=Sphingobium sp. YG1 TaxID=2082188 RepID=UPI000E718BAC|nr:S24 family peptidase [Sphingobium sp. YG1]
MEPIALQLKALRNRTVPKISSRDVATALEMPSSTYAAYEDPKKFKKPLLPFQLAKKIAAIFAARGVPEAETMALAGLTGELSSALTRELPLDENEWVEVNGSVAAGVWKEQSDWPSAERYDVRFGPNRFRGAERFGLRMEGLSMNRTVPPGADLECIRVTFSHFEPKPGDLVIVERTNHDLTEMTCKRLDMDGDEWILRCESTEPEFQDFIRIGKPSAENHIDDEARVIAIVVGAKLDLAPTGLSERRFRYR